MRYLIVILFSLAAFTANADESANRNWQFSFEPYLLAASIKGDATMGRVEGVPIDVDFSAILETLQMAAMSRFEAQHKSGWGILFDYGFMDLGADTTVGLGGVVDAGVKQGILEVLATRSVDVAVGELELLAGVRWWDNKVKASFDPVIIEGSLGTVINEDWLDPVIGARWTRGVSERWQVQLRADVGGFGVASDFSWGASASGFYNYDGCLHILLQQWTQVSKNAREGSCRFGQTNRETTRQKTGR